MIQRIKRRRARRQISLLLQQLDRADAGRVVHEARACGDPCFQDDPTRLPAPERLFMTDQPCFEVVLVGERDGLAETVELNVSLHAEHLRSGAARAATRSSRLGGESR